MTRHARVLALTALVLAALTLLAPPLAHADAAGNHHRHRHATAIALVSPDQGGTIARADHATAIAEHVPAVGGLHGTIASDPSNARGRAASVVDAPTSRGPPSGH